MKYAIPSPCHEDWKKMKIGLTSRFCESCTKDVMDFTKMSRQEILEYLLENQGQRTCGRILPSQLDFTRRDIVVTLHQMKKRYPRHQLPMAVMLIAGMMLAGCNERRATKVTEVKKTEKQNIEKDSSLQIPEKPKLGDNSKEPININTVTIEGETMGFMVAESDSIQIGTSTIEVFGTPYEDACFPGGSLALEKFIETNYLIKNQEDIGKTIYLKFTVNKDSTLTNIEVRKGISKEADQEAIRVVSIMPKWIPGKLNGEIYTSNYTLPIKIGKNNQVEEIIVGEIVDENSFFRFQNLSAEEYISKKFTKKSSAHASEKLILSFEVGIDGKISNISITQSVSEKLDQYARQLISEMPAWLPSKHNGKNITSSVKIEITVPGLFEKAKVKVFQF